MRGGTSVGYLYLQTAVLFVQGGDEEREVQVLHGYRRFF